MHKNGNNCPVQPYHLSLSLCRDSAARIQQDNISSRMVERVTSNDEVAGSIPSEGIHFCFLSLLLMFATNFYPHRNFLVLCGGVGLVSVAFKMPLIHLSSGAAS